MKREQAEEFGFDQMKWTKPESGSARVTAAGKIIAERKQPNDNLSKEMAFEIASNWRSSHGYALQVLSMTLRRRARNIDPKALIAQRLKRMPSVIAKLKRFQGMQLSQMQDLGGCRAVVSTAKQVDKLVTLYERKACATAEFFEKYDHISKPKADGYRSVHFVYRYKSKHPDRAQYNGLRIEVQIRSVYQHAWATALETIDTFTWQRLKSGLGKPEWKRFFVLMSSFIAVMEKRPLVEGVRDDPYDIRWFDELEALIEKLNVVATLDGLRSGVHIAKDVPASAAYILVLDLDTQNTEVIGFNSSEEAARSYEEIEKQTIDQPNIQAVQVSVESLGALREAYPNYYLDTSRFVGILQGFLRATKARKNEKKQP